MNGEQLSFEIEKKEPIKGFPELRWTGKRPFTAYSYFPAQLRERYGGEEEIITGGKSQPWINRLYWGDNLQVMGHLLREFRGKIDLIYIDPPFDSKADYKKKIQLRGQAVTNDSTAFEEKQYGDIWTNDEYLQFMYERLLLMKELLSDKGSIYLHCDWHKSAYLRCIMDEVFGADKFVNEIVWCYSIGGKGSRFFGRKHDTILLYSKTSDYYFNGYDVNVVTTRKTNSHMRLKTDADGRQYQEKTDKKSGKVYKYYVDEGKIPEDYWIDIEQLNREDGERLGYPTQKPEAVIKRIISASTPPNGLVFDCFMGSGTTQAVAMKLGRRFIGADINLGAIQTTTKRLISLAAEIDKAQLAIIKGDEPPKYTGFEVFNVNNYNFFRNPVEARQLLIDALEIQPFPTGHIYDGEKDGRMVKIMPVNRIATRADLEELQANLPYKEFERVKESNPGTVVLRLLIVCMGHEPDLKEGLLFGLVDYKVDLEICDILRDKTDLQLKREAEVDIAIEEGRLVIRQFYPLNLMQKLSLDKEYIEDWRQLAESVMIDWNFDGVVMEPAVTDIPDKKSLVKGIYDIPEDAGTIKVKITDLLSESLEVEVRV
ncbi:MAG: site-specific DNA-methyltransferase [Oscillospiraceae bacterium]|jgi:DNA modification methylase|nr:site-specific DNA-methyltransferase [Oscillospiraceae bacterium]